MKDTGAWAKAWRGGAGRGGAGAHAAGLAEAPRKSIQWDWIHLIQSFMECPSHLYLHMHMQQQQGTRRWRSDGGGGGSGALLLLGGKEL